MLQWRERERQKEEGARAWENVNEGKREEEWAGLPLWMQEKMLLCQALTLSHTHKASHPGIHSHFRRFCLPFHSRISHICIDVHFSSSLRPIPFRHVFFVFFPSLLHFTLSTYFNARAHTRWENCVCVFLPPSIRCMPFFLFQLGSSFSIFLRLSVRSFVFFRSFFWFVFVPFFDVECSFFSIFVSMMCCTDAHSGTGTLDLSINKFRFGSFNALEPFIIIIMRLKCWSKVPLCP